MNPGDEIICPLCQQDAFLIKTTLMDGWNFKGEILICSLCKQKIVDIDKNNGKEVIKSDLEIDRFAAFLGTEKKDSKVIITNDENKSFCRDCKHYISHPFMNRCQLHSKEVSPMDDCHNFTVKS